MAGAGNGKGMADDSEDSSDAPLLSGSLLCQKEGQMAVFRRGSPVCQCCFPVTVGGRAERRREGQAVVQEQTGLSLCFGQSSEEKISGLLVGWECGRLRRKMS